ncbi:MAG: DMT family transporter [Alphaproteobacteria bacterium]
MTDSSASRLASTWRALPPTIRGTILALVAMAVFPAVHSAVRFLSGSIHPLEIAFFRNLFGLLFMAPWFWRAGLKGLKTDKPHLHLIRAITGTSAITAWFWGLALMPVADATALSFTAPFFITVAAVLVLGEKVGWRRAAAIGVGFVGAMVIIRPGFQGFNGGALVVLSSSVFAAGSITLMKLMSRTHSSEAIVAWMFLLMTPLSFVPALFVWTWPSLTELSLLLFIGGGATVAHLVWVKALSIADASYLTNFEYSRLPYAALFGLLLFNEWPDLLTWVGAAIIISAAVFVARREIAAARAHGRADAHGDAPVGLASAPDAPPLKTPDTSP